MRIVFLLILMTAASFNVFAQLKLGNAKSEINFREGPGLNYKILSTINKSNLLVILPRESKNNFIEVFDIETSSYGFVAENLIVITDTLNFQKQHFFESAGENETGEIEIEMLNKTSQLLYVWINRNSYNLSPFEQKVLVMDTTEIVYFSSAPGKFPVFGKESLKRGNSYIFSVSAQQNDTLKLAITQIEKKLAPDTVYNFSSRTDTIAMQPLITDTSKIVHDVNPQDLVESKYKVKLLGSVRVNGYYDFNGMTSTEGFKPYEIPVGEDNISGLSAVYIGARQSRFGIEGTANTKVGSIKTYIEVDFASQTSSYFRLRHAFAEWNFWKLGYTWTTFMDNASLPKTVEFEGPNSSTSKRHGLIRYERKFENQSIFGVSIESPKADYYNPNDSLIQNASNQRNIDLAGRYKYYNRWGHIQLAGILRNIDFLQNGKMETKRGGGILLSTTIHINEKHQINSQYSIGKGIAYYYVGFNEKQLDAVYNPNTESMMLKGIQGGFINYSYQYTKQFIFSAIVGLSGIKNEEFEPDDSFKASQYIAANAFYNPIETISLGLELTYGSRKNFDNQKGNANRISMLAKFDF
jgi:hypothetical protein